MRAVLSLLFVASASSIALQAQPRGAAALGPLVSGLGVSGRVLVIAAHPDDEDTQLIAWLARGRQVETAYLSLTRGDGGQNLIGNELGEPLGAIRTEELLAARRLDGGRQYFTRAFDFGFSKNAQETLTQWAKDSILRDVVTVVRAFRPHVIVSVFSGTPADGHGHHQVAGILAREAYDISADTVRFPARSTAGLGAWTVPKFYRGALFRNQAQATIRINVGEYDPLGGRSYAELAADSRSQHKSQAMGALQQKGVRYDQLLREAARVGPSDARSERSIFDGVDTTWGRFRDAMQTPAQRAALAALPAAFAAARRSLDLGQPGAVIPALVEVQRLLSTVCGAASGTNPCATLASDGSLVVRHADLHASVENASVRVHRAFELATGVAVEAVAAREGFATGEPVRVRRSVHNRGSLPVRVLRTVVLGARAEFTQLALDVRPDSTLGDSLSLVIDRVGAAWWLTRPRQGAMFAVPGAAGDEAGQRPSPMIVTTLEVAGATFSTWTPVTYRYADAIRGEVNRPIVAAPAITLTLEREVEYARANAPLQRTVRVTVRSHADGPREVAVRLDVPPGLTVDSAVRRVQLPGNARAATAQSAPAATFGLSTGTQGDAIEVVTFQVRGQLNAGRHAIRASATSGGETFTTGYTAVSYDHIQTQRLFRPATLGLEAVDLNLPRVARVAYINGVGDNSAPILQQLGLDVTVIDPADLMRTDLSRFTSVVVGTRAYEASPALVSGNPRLLAYAREGGTLVVQYGQYEMLNPGMMPFPITLGRPADRVTVEGAPVRVLDPAASVLTAPNTISTRDFDGWTQDRSLYMPRTFDPAYTPLLEMNDPGEGANRGALLVAPYGKGVYVYTSLAFFRQLPAGVPGAARLFVNLLSAKPGSATQ
ncbi:MAG: PIG-L family deacetylase [Gemmatimonadetes bacterium]|nr:PIG-L family deacetylase [Gemmatimonadota bacterium]